jgi:hypothetical protein
VVFPSIHRAEVAAVRSVTELFDPARPREQLGAHRPVVTEEPTAGLLFLFDGGDVLHGVSAVREGVRAAAVFLFQQDRPPEQSRDTAASCKYFYDDGEEEEDKVEEAPDTAAEQREKGA